MFEFPKFSERICRTFLVAFIGGLAAQMPLTALAQSYPAKPIRLIHGFAVGAAIDVFSRPLAQKLSQAFGQQVLVESRPGATGTIANELVSKSVPDGYTILAAPSSAMTATPHLYKVRYRPLQDFAPVIQIAQFSFVIISHPNVPAKNVKGLISLAKAKPGLLTYGSPGVGTGFHLAGELFAMMAGIKMLHVPYKGGGSAAQSDLLAGRVDLMWNSLGVILPYLRAGKIRSIATTGSRRAAALPEVPTVAESGLPGYEMVGWHGIFTPANTPRPIIDKLHSTIVKILATPDFKELWNTMGMEVVESTPETFAARMQHDYQRYGKLISDLEIKL